MKTSLINRIALLGAILFFATGNLYAETHTVTTETVDKDTPGSVLFEAAQLQDGDVLTFDRSTVNTIILTLLDNASFSISKRVTIQGNGVTIRAVLPDEIKDDPGAQTVSHGVTLNGTSFLVENVHFEAGLTITATSSVVKNCTFKPYYSKEKSLSLTYKSASSTHSVEGCAFLTDGDNMAYCNIGSATANYSNTIHFTSCTFVNTASARQTVVKQGMTSQQAKKFVTFTNCVLLDPGATDGSPSVNLYNMQSNGYNVFQGVIKPVSGGPAWETKISDAVIPTDDATARPLTLDENMYKVTVNDVAYRRLPANPKGTVDALADVSFPEYDLSGNGIDYMKPTHSGAWQTVFGDEDDGNTVTVTDIIVNFPANEVLFTDTVYQFQAAVLSENNNATQEVTWECADPHVTLTPSGTGNLNATFRAEGITEDTSVTVKLTAADNGSDSQPFVKEYLITLKPYIHVTGITLPDLPVPFGYERGLRATVAPAGANWKELEWTVDDPSVASITVHGDSITVKGLSEDITTITARAKDNSIIGTATVTISRPDYSDGVFIVNEDWWGHRPGSVNFLYNDGHIDYNAFFHANDRSLGTPAQFGAIYGGRFYIISKAGLQLAIADAKTMELKKGFVNPGGEGRFFFGVDEHTGYVGTSNGIRVVNLNELPNVPGDHVAQGQTGPDPEIVTNLPGTNIAAAQSSTGAFKEQVTTMKRVGDRIFALQQGLLHIINATTHQVEVTLNDYIYIAMTQSKDGDIWLGTSGTVPTGEGWNPTEEADEGVMSDGELTNYFVRLDPWTLEQKVVTLPSNVTGPGSVYGAWQADAFQGSALENVIYWKSGHQSISRYDIMTNRVDTVLDLEDMPKHPDSAAPWTLYGTSFAVDHRTGELVVTTGTFVITCCVNGRNNWKILRVNPNGGQPRVDAEGVIGNIISEHPLEKNYWFPAMPVFPDKYRPEFTDVPFPSSVTLNTTHPVDSLGLLDRVNDADNMRTAMVTTVLDGYDKTLMNAFIWRDTLVVAARKTIPAGQPAESTVVTLKFNSNGHVITKEIPVTIEPPMPTDIARTIASNAAVWYSNGTLRLRNLEGYNCSITSVSGQVLGNFTAASGEEIRPVSLPSGVYMLTAQKEGERLAFKFVLAE
jgi:hypothetical protein